MTRLPAVLALAAAGAVLAGAGTAQNLGESSRSERSIVEPPFSIWDVRLGEAASDLPDLDVNDIACGTNGGPPGQPLVSFTDFASCRPEASGLHEVAFAYDDELDYVARAMNLPFEVFQDGTSVFAHAVVLSVLIDEGGTVQGYRILTDPRIPQRERRRSVTLMRNFIARFEGEGWALDCVNLELAPGEMPVGNGFTKNMCTGTDPEGETAIRLDSRYLRKPGQVAVNRETQEVNSEYFESFSRLEMVRLPFEPTPPPVLER